MAYVTEHNTDIGFICKLCLSKFHKGLLPSACILNNLVVKPLSDFMFYRISMITKKMLIKRVSSFQVVQTMSCVSNKHMSYRQMIRKVKGRTFYLLLQETFNKVSPLEDRINLNHELFEVYPKCLKLFGKIWWILIKCIRLRHRTWRSIECFSYSSRMNLRQSIRTCQISSWKFWETN